MKFHLLVTKLRPIHGELSAKTMFVEALSISQLSCCCISHSSWALSNKFIFKTCFSHANSPIIVFFFAASTAHSNSQTCTRKVDKFWASAPKVSCALSWMEKWFVRWMHAFHSSFLNSSILPGIVALFDFFIFFQLC